MAHARSPSLFHARVAAVLAAGIALAQLTGLAGAQTNNNANSFPTKPVRVVVPFSPGGTSDILARMIMPLALTTPEEHDRVLRADIETFSGVVRLAGLRPK